MVKDKFVEAPVDMVGSDAGKIRKLLDIHPRRDIPAKIVNKYRSMHHMMSRFKGGFTRDALVVLCAMGCKTVRRGLLNGQSVLLVDGEDLSTDPDAAEKSERAKVAKVEALARKEVQDAAMASRAASMLKDALSKVEA